jgi:hypothetical protein
MKLQLISYDLITPGRDYKKLFEAIKAHGTWSRPLESVWIVATTKASGEIRESLEPYIDTNDKLLVVALAGNWATRNVSKEVTDWLKQNLAA